MTKLQEMKNKLTTVVTEAQNLLNDGKVEESKVKMTEAKALKEQIQLQEEIDDEVKDSLVNAPVVPTVVDAEPKVTDTLNHSANVVRAMIKKVTGAPLTKAENALLVPSSGNGTNGEGYILPVDVSTRIRKKIREYSSLTSVVGYLPAGALSGSFPVENFETVSELVDFEDGTDGVDTNDIKFKSVSYKLKQKGAFIKLSNTLLAMTDEDLIEYVSNVFAKKAVITENKIIVAAIKNGKSAKELKGWVELKKSINVDLDPAVLFGMGIVTNQDGFNYLDEQLDTTGRPILQPNPTNPTQRMFMGYPVHVFSNAILPTVATKAPIFYGNLKEGVAFVDHKGLINFATSSEAGFMSNTTIARLIEFIDAIQVDASDKCYIVGELNLSEAHLLEAKAKTK